MKKQNKRNKFLSWTLGFLLSTTSLTAHAQQAVHFDGHTRLFNPGGVIAPITTTSVVCSYWYRTTSTQPAVILDSSVDNLRASLLVVHQGLMGNTGGVLLNVFMGGIDASWQVVSLDPLPTNGTWQQVVFTADTITKKIKWSLQGREKQFDNDSSFFIGADGFGMVFGNNRWSVSGSNHSRALLPPIFFGGHYYGSIVGRYNGDLAELMCYFSPGGYADITNTRRLQSGFPKANFSRELVNGLGQRVLFGPEDLGPSCMGVFFVQPTLCMRGNREYFPKNQNAISGSATSFIVIEGQLQTATSDPFSLWGPGGAP